MNAVARVALAENALIKNVKFNFYLPELKILALVFLLLVSALGVVYVKDLNRRLFITHHNLQVEEQKLNARSNKLLLEQSAWGAQARVQVVAEKKLKMQIPLSTKIIMIKI